MAITYRKERKRLCGFHQVWFVQNDKDVDAFRNWPKDTKSELSGYYVDKPSLAKSDAKVKVASPSH